MKKREFTLNMSRNELIFTLIYLPIHTIILPLLMNWHAEANPDKFTTTQYNLLYLCLSFAVALIGCRKFLRADFDVLLDNKWQSFVTFIRSYLLSFALGYLMIIVVILLIGTDMTNWVNPNDEMVYDLATDDFYQVLCVSVFLAPIVEEVLFRGAIFGAIRRKNRLLAYVVSVALFAILHVWQYAVALSSVEMLVYMVDYIPAGIVLAWCYERSGTIWLPIFFHMGTNMMALSLINYI